MLTEEQLHTLIIYELSDRHGRFLAWEIHAPGRAPAYAPSRPVPSHIHHRERILHHVRAGNAQPDRWERVFA